MAGYLRSEISVLVKGLLVIYGETESNSQSCFDDVLKFVLAQMDRMPWLLKFAIKTLTLCFGFSCFLHRCRLLFSASPEKLCEKRLLAWSRSSLRPCRDFVKFYAAMVVLSLYSVPKPLNVRVSDE